MLTQRKKLFIIGGTHKYNTYPCLCLASVKLVDQILNISCSSEWIAEENIDQWSILLRNGFDNFLSQYSPGDSRRGTKFAKHGSNKQLTRAHLQHAI